MKKVSGIIGNWNGEDVLFEIRHHSALSRRYNRTTPINGYYGSQKKRERRSAAA
ncbi:hypothetical protein OAL04_03405 [Nitrospinae bacterium]|nr:hypothetical protein [Nitrospinota bacterium]